MRILRIEKNDAGQRLDKFLSKAVKGLPLSMMYKAIRTKKIKVNRARAKENQILMPGDEVQLFIKDEFFDLPAHDDGALSAIVPKLDIIYEDENILLLNKRPGVLVHEDATGGENTLALHLKAYLYQKGEYDPDVEQSFAPALCNRIDRNTGGIVIAAKNAEALRLMNEKIKQNEITKIYICAAHGIPKRPRATLTGYLLKDSAKNMVTVSAKISSQNIRCLPRVVAIRSLRWSLSQGVRTRYAHIWRISVTHCSVTANTGRTAMRKSAAINIRRFMPIACPLMRPGARMPFPTLRGGALKFPARIFGS